MKRTWILTTITSVLAVFLALPLVFDAWEEPVPLQLEEIDKKGTPLPFDHEGVADSVLPTLSGGKKGKLPGQSTGATGLLGRYIARVGNFYKNSFNALTGGAAGSSAARSGGALYASSTRAGAAARQGYSPDALDNSFAASAEGSRQQDEDNDFNYYGTAESSYSQSAGVGTQQKVHPTAHVPGLYQIPATDKDKVFRKQVYEGVMFNLNAIVPGIVPQKAERAYAPSKILTDTKPAQVLRSGGADIVPGEYTGIASRGGSTAGSASGNYGSFGGTSVRASGADGSGFDTYFGAAESELRADMQKLTGGSLGGGVISGNGQGQQTQNPGGQQNNPNNKPGQGHGHGGQGQGGQGNNGGNTGTGPGTGTNPEQNNKPLYDKDNWPSNEPSETDICINPNADDGEDNPPITRIAEPLGKPKSDKNNPGEPPNPGEKPAQPNPKYKENDKVNPNCYLEPFDSRITDKYKDVVVNVGWTTDGKAVVLAYDAPLQQIIDKKMGKVISAAAPAPSSGSPEDPGVEVITEEEYNTRAAKPTTLALTTDANEPGRNRIVITEDQPGYNEGLTDLEKDIIAKIDENDAQ